MTHKQTLVLYENITIQRQHKNIYTPHMIRSTMVPNFCKLELPQPSYHSIKTLQVFLQDAFLH